MYIIKTEPDVNFGIWHNFNEFMNASKELVTFIDNGILESAPCVFLELFQAAEAKIKQAYDSLLKAVNQRHPHIKNMNWKLHYDLCIYEITQSVHEFDPRQILLRTLSLKPEYEERVLKLIGEKS